MMSDTSSRPPDNPSPRGSLSVAVVLRTKTRDREVFEVLDAIETQVPAPREIIIIDSGSDAAILAGLQQYARDAAAGQRRVALRIIEIPADRYQSARTLNEAIATTDADLIAILSQDATPLGTSYLANLAAPLERDEDLAGTYARQVPRHTCAFAAKDLAKTYTERSRDQSAPDSWFVNTCSMVRRALWVQHPFSEAAIISEDHEWAAWAQSQGYRVRYEATAVVRHSHPFVSYRALWQRHFDEGLGLARVGARPNAVRAAISILREIASDILWFPPNGYTASLWRSPWHRVVKNVALWRGLCTAQRNTRD